MKVQLCCLVVVSILVALVDAHAYDDTHTYVYGLIIDAGSSGSRIYTYAWLQRKDTGLPDLVTAPVNQTQWSYKISPGLSTFANNLPGIAAYLKPLIDYALSNLDPAVVPSTVLYLKATGGLRALAQSDQDAIIAETRKYFRTTSFNFTDSYASVIQLEQEALYGWMTVNYLLGTFDGGSSTYGALDMGGATTEISFIPASSSLARNTSLTLNSRNYNVYTGGYAARGLDTALLLVLTQLANDAAAIDPSANVLWNPCYLQGYAENTTLTITTITAATNLYTIYGTGNSTACRELTSRVLLNTDVACPIPDCAFNGVYQPPLTGTFYAYSGYFYTYDVLFSSHPQISLKDLLDASSTFCGLSITAAQAQHPAQGLSFLKNYCFTSSYLYPLLRVYGFSDDSVINFVGSIKGIEVGWSLGGMLYEANLLPIEIVIPTPDVTDAGSFTTTSVVLVLLIAIFELLFM